MRSRSKIPNYLATPRCFHPRCTSPEAKHFIERLPSVAQQPPTRTLASTQPFDLITSSLFLSAYKNASLNTFIYGGHFGFTCISSSFCDSVLSVDLEYSSKQQPLSHRDPKVLRLSKTTPARWQSQHKHQARPGDVGPRSIPISRSTVSTPWTSLALFSLTIPGQLPLLR